MLKGPFKERKVKRLLCSKLSFTLAAVAIFLVGMLRDPDLANSDELSAEPVAQDHLPAYQYVPDRTGSHPLTAAEIAKLNRSPDGDVPTF
jgi:hypothetical protein